MTPVKLKATIYQGATFRLILDRYTYPYAVTQKPDGSLMKSDGSAAPEEDRVSENYSDCTARMQIRETIASETILLELTTENSGLILSGARMTVYMTDTQTASLTSGWQTAIGHIEVERANGDVERQYEITFTLDKEATR